MQTEAQPIQHAPTIAAVITHEVHSFELWKRAFDNHAAARRGAGIVATHVNRHADHPQRLSVYLAGSDADKLEAFLGSASLVEAMRDAGVTGVPHIAIIAPVEDLTVKDRALAGVIVRHEVQAFATWKRAFDAHAGERALAGVLGHAVNRSTHNPDLVVVYLQAESLDTLRAFCASSELTQSMKAAGVTGAPELDFVSGSEWAA